MTEKDRAFLDRINAYSEEAMPDIDPQNTRISLQLEKLMPVLNTIAQEEGVPVEDIFIRYMDLASEAFVATSRKVNQEFEGILGTDDESFQIN